MTGTSFFLSLFKRGRYYRLPTHIGGGMESGERKEIERFTAAALAFSFHHDPAFQLHFWNKICRVDGDPSTPVSPTIEIEPHPWADLIVRSQDGQRRLVHVIECKVGAGLEAHQNPQVPSFAEDGYGFQLIKHEGSVADLRYIVLGLREPLHLPQRHPTLPIWLAQRRWGDLECPPPAGSLMEDLFNTLGELGVGNFHMHRTKNLTITTGLQGIAQAYAIIDDTLRSLDLDRCSGKITVARLSDTSSWLGCYLHVKGKSATEAQLQKTLQSSDYLSWVGYIANADASVERSVWLYCEDAARAQWLKKALAPEFPVSSIEKDDGYHCVVIAETAASGIPDSKWFSQVLNAACALAATK